MPPRLSPRDPHWPQDTTDIYDHSCRLNPMNDAPPAKRVKRLFQDPEHMPSMTLVFSEYDSSQNIYRPALQGGLSLPPGSLHLHKQPSRNESGSMTEDSPTMTCGHPSTSVITSPSYPLSLSRTWLRELDSSPRTPQFTTASIWGGMDERALSDHLRHCSSTVNSTAKPSSSSSVAYPCPPISLSNCDCDNDDDLESPLQRCMEAYAEGDRASYYQSANGSAKMSSPRPISVRGRHRRDRGNSQWPTPQSSFESMDSALTATVYAEVIRSPGNRGRSSTWSSDVTTVGPSSLPSALDKGSILYGHYYSTGSLKKKYIHDNHLTNTSNDNIHDTYIHTSGSDDHINETLITPFIRHGDDKTWDRGVEIPTSDSSTQPNYDRHALRQHPLSSDYPTHDLSTLYEDHGRRLSTTGTGTGNFDNGRNITRGAPLRRSSMPTNLYFNDHYDDDNDKSPPPVWREGRRVVGHGMGRRLSSHRPRVAEPIEEFRDEPVVGDSGDSVVEERVVPKDHRLITTMADAIRHRYIGLSYKVRLALFRTEKAVTKNLHRRKKVVRDAEAHHTAGVDVSRL